jgi:hypothetical protein
MECFQFRWQQILACLLTGLFIGAFSGCFVTGMQERFDMALAAVFYGGVLLMAVCLVLVYCCCPAAPLDMVESNFYCAHCNSYVPEAAKHCKYCNRCMIGFDHHCKWINFCIGHRNYRFFVGLVVGMVVMLSAFLTASARLIIAGKISPGVVTLWVVSPLPAVCWLAGASLLAFHIFLWCKGKTTYEYVMVPRVVSAGASESDLPAGREKGAVII